MALTRLRASNILDSDYKSSCRVTTATNITLSGGAPNIVDGITLVKYDRVLVRSQDTPSQNGIYRVTTVGSGSNGTWVRDADANVNNSISAGSLVYVESGTSYGGKFYYLTTTGAITIGSTSLSFSDLLGSVATTAITNGNSNVSVAANSNVTVSVAGNANILTVTGTGANISGTLNVSGNSNISNVSIYNANITSTGTNANLNIDANGTGSLVLNAAGDNSAVIINGNTTSGYANLIYADTANGRVGILTGSPSVNVALHVAGTTSALLPKGNTAQRPSVGIAGMIRYNTTDNNYEYYNGADWSAVGSSGVTLVDADSFTGDGSTAVFTLSRSSTTDATVIAVNGVLQEPTVAYSVTGNVLTFTEAPAVSDLIDARTLVTTTTVTSISDGDSIIGITDPSAGTAYITIDGANTFIANSSTTSIKGNLLPTANVTYDLGSGTMRWKDLYLSGTTIKLGNIVIKETSTNTIGFFQSDGTTAAVLDANVDIVGDSIASGTSNVSFASSGGNVRIVSGGTTVANITSTGANISGTANISGNANVGNLGTAQLLASANVTTPQLISNVATGTAPLVVTSTTQVANLNAAFSSNAVNLNNGTSNVVVTNNGNITVGSAGNAAILTVTGTGANIAGTANITGNANTGNLGTTTLIATTGNITTINSGLVQNGNSNVTVASNGNVSVFVTGNATARAVFTSTGANIAGTANITGNANTGNLGTTTLIATTGNITTVNSGLVQNGNSNVTIAANGNISLFVTGNATARAVFTSTGANIAGTANISGNANVGNLGVSSVITTSILEPGTVSATAATGTINYDVLTQSVLYYTSNAAANWTVNFRASSGTSLDTLMTTGQFITVTFLVTQGATPYYNSAVQIDGNSVTPKYQGGAAWTAGNASGIDIYTYTIIKTGSATFTVLASQTQFK